MAGNIKLNEVPAQVLVSAIEKDSDLFDALKGSRYTSFVEKCDDYQLVEREVAWAESVKGHAYSFKGSTVHDLSLSYVITEVLRGEHNISDEAGYNIYTALHEALINAVVRGNLGIEALYADSEGFNTYVECVSQAINGRAGEKRVRISVTIEANGTIKIVVEDEGEGFNPKGMMEKMLKEGRYHGRGLAIIESCSDGYTHNDKANIITMRFTP